MTDSHRNRARLALGVWCPALTPLDAALNPDPVRFIDHLRWLLDQGCHGLVIFGTTGEAPSFSVEERMMLLERVVEAGLPPSRLMVGNGCCALGDTLRLTRHAVELGCDRVLMMPPFYFKNVGDEGLFRSFGEVIERLGSSRLKIWLYHFPQLSGVPLSFGLIDRLLTAYPQSIAGIKDSSGDAEHTLALIARYPDLAVFPGSDALLARGLRAGGAGCITASANVNASAIRGVYDAFESGGEALDARQEKTNRVRQALEKYPLIAGLKQILAHYRKDPDWGYVRPPLVSLSEEEKRGLLTALSETGFRFAAG